ncbi:MAG TPA: indolepyruvate oxidoreductase subunit beta family protein [Beijerinckiaceae bacterium]|nr:indolepyruvate oxidoreductase subunit beta family protein [Beijerinckiaceae bacterium]
MSARPLRLLIAALGGEGGGVLAGWIVEAALEAGLWAQRTSIPGVAQRTGATTYYVELLAREGPQRPVLALSPAPGEVDVLVSSELLETARQAQAGFVTPQRTLVIASTSRVLTIAEKQAMADGRADSAELIAVIRRFARRALLDDLDGLAKDSGSRLNAVLLGALAGADALPIPVKAFRDAIRREGKSVEGNLRGFEAGLRMGAGQGTGARAPISAHVAIASDASIPPEAAEIFREGVRRLTDYQDAAYAQLYKDRLMRFVGRSGADGVFIRELARTLAVRMSVEDTIRVAQLKLSQARLARLRTEARAKPSDIVHVIEFLKPGPDEILGVLPSALAKPLLAWVRRSRFARSAIPIRLRTTSLRGTLQLAFLSSLRRWRLNSLRYQQEKAWVECWLDLIDRSLAIDPEAATQIVLTAGLVKGYGETYERGLGSWRRIADEIIEPMLDGRLPARHFADSVLQARIAASADPEGARLSETIASLRALPVAGLKAAAE